MGARNFLIEGVSGTGKTTVCDELQRRGYHAIHGDRELSYQGDRETGRPLEGAVHAHHIWDVDKVKSLIADQRNAMSFFCGGSRNFPVFIDLFDRVFVLDVDIDTLNRRLDTRPKEEFGGRPEERALILRLHSTKEDVPRTAITIDATAPVACVVDDILRRCEELDHGTGQAGGDGLSEHWDSSPTGHKP
jgi:hypothetical protein